VKLEVRPRERIIPEYSLTGDLLSFRTCEKQYRYYNGSSLPPSRPVQLWYGEFIHGVLEQAFRLWDATRPGFPWPYTAIDEEERGVNPPPLDLEDLDLRKFGWTVERPLLQQGKRARSAIARRSAYRRAYVAVNMLGPHLFPLITAAEQRLTKTRDMPEREGNRRASHYILTGIVDVLTNMSMSAESLDNPITRAVRAACPNLDGDYEVIVDYKSSRRPHLHNGEGEVDLSWRLGEWQVKTYAWLRSQQPDAPRVAAGVLLYLNELSPSSNDVERLRRDIANQKDITDVRPAAGSRDELLLDLTRSGTRVELSEAFRLRRAIRVIPIDETTYESSMAPATQQFDLIVGEIEDHIEREAATGSISQTWTHTCQDWQTCVACDFKTFCPGALKRPSSGRGQPDMDEADEDDDEIPPEEL
jgi:hypothetical protein